MTFADYGIDIPQNKVSGNVNTTCPKCSHERKKSQQKCLNVNLDKKVWRCNHCEWSGGITEKYVPVSYEVPKWENKTILPDKVLKYFENRRITANTLNEFKVSSCVEFMPQEGKEMDAICFNYFKNGKLVNIKYRDGKKNFKLYKGAELILYNIDSLANAKEVWITEGEIDCLSLFEAGIKEVVSVPNGAGSNLSYLDNYMSMFDTIERIHICTDNDLKGRELRENLSERFGKDKCDYVEFGECKDANEYLVLNGNFALKEQAYKFIQFPLVGVFTISDIQSEIIDLYNNGLPQGCGTGMPTFDRLLKFHKGYVTTITGIPGHGKSDFLDHILIKLLQHNEWKGAFYSPENRPTHLHFSKIARKLVQRPWFGRERMNPDELFECMHLLDEKFWFIKPETDFTLDSILSHVAVLKNRKGIDWFVIDAWNKLEHKYTDSETRYIGQSLDKIVNFCERNNVHCFLVAHPTKMRKSDGQYYDVPNLYDISGSANFFNKTDNGICVYRNFRTEKVEVYIQKVKFSHWGEVGMAEFQYDLQTGLYIQTN